MNIYDYLQEGEVVDKACLLAAHALIEAGIHVVPLKDKSPANIKDLTALRRNPINKHNCAYYFDREGIDLGIMLTGKMEVIDIDEKQQKGIVAKVLTTLEMANPDLFERLVISRSPSGGAHIYYTADQIGGDAVIAYTLDGNGKMVGKIERIDESNKKYIKTAPSAGYYFQQGSPLELPHLSIEDRNYIISICRSFNEVSISEATKIDKERKDAPWRMFNDKHDYTYIVKEIQERGWKIVQELDDRIIIKSPNTTQRQSGSIWKNNATKYNLQNCLYLFTHNSEFEQAKPYSPFDVYKLYYHDGNFIQAQAKLASEGYGRDIVNEGDFWIKEGRKINVKYTDLLHYYKQLGYCKYLGQLVQVIDNVVSIRETGDIVRQFLTAVEPVVKNYFFERVSTIFSDNGGLMTMLDELDDNFVRDDAASTWFFFRNRAIRVYADRVEEMLYKDLTAYIWKESIIDRDFNFIDHTNCDADRFVTILGGEMVDKLRSIIGYALNRYKNELITKTVILMEDINPDDEGESMGRSGKGLVFKMIEQFRKTCRMNGKSFNFHDAFLWQNVELDTDIIFIDDVEKSFAFTKLYSVITESIQVNKKGVKQIVIPYSKSPKIFITSNYAVGNSDESTIDRKFEFPVVKYFNAQHKPVDEFGRAFFSEWDATEWRKFDNFMLSCAQAWLTSDKRNLSHVTGNTANRILINQTHPDFVAYMDDQLAMNFFDFAPASIKNARLQVEGGKLITNAVNMDTWQANCDSPDYYMLMRKEDLFDKFKTIPKITTTKVTQWLKLWAMTRKIEINLSHKKKHEAGRYYRIVNWTHETGSHFEAGTEGEKSVLGDFKVGTDEEYPLF